MILIDTGVYTGSVSSEIISEICIKHQSILKVAPIKMAMPDLPEPTSYALTKNFFLINLK